MTSIGVLVCDDAPEIRMLISVVIGLRDGQEVVGEAADGQQAVDQARRLQPDVVLLDLSMPVRTGLDALPEIKQVAPAAKVIVLSGFAGSNRVAAECVKLGADGYLEKGVRPEEIADAIEQVVRPDEIDLRSSEHETQIRRA